MPITFDRSVCCDLQQTIVKEWLLTNSRGGYASGTVAGVVTRLAHGLLVTPGSENASPHVLLAKIDEELSFDQRTYYLSTNEYRDGTLTPTGFLHLEKFHLHHGLPVWTYNLGGMLGLILEKTIWMPRDQHTTYIQYRFSPTPKSKEKKRSTSPLPPQQGPVTLKLLPFVADRAANLPQHGNLDWHFETQLHQSSTPHSLGCTLRSRPDAAPFHLFVISDQETEATILPTGVWYWHFRRRSEPSNEHTISDDLYLPGVVRLTLNPNQSKTVTIAVSTESLDQLCHTPEQVEQSYQQAIIYEDDLWKHVRSPKLASQPASPVSALPGPYKGNEEYLRWLLQASDHFLVTRQGKQGPEASIYADFYTLEVRTRDLLMALPGLTLTTERYDTALLLLRTTARHFQDGILPALLTQDAPGPDAGADLPLLFFVALGKYIEETGDYTCLAEFSSALLDLLQSYIHGTASGIILDPEDGLLLIRRSEYSLTWMNAVVDGKSVTPRYGKPIEINALWYHVLTLVERWLPYLPDSYRFVPYKELLLLFEAHFTARFWSEEKGFFSDVVDGPAGDDTSLRPNQLLALSLCARMLKKEHRVSAFDQITHELLTPYGIRSLAPSDPLYVGHFNASQPALSLHQGSVWPWLFTPYLDCLLSIGNPSQQHAHHYQEYLWRKGLSLLEPLKGSLENGLLGLSNSFFSGSYPHSPGPSLASAISSSSLIHSLFSLSHLHSLHLIRALA